MGLSDESGSLRVECDDCGAAIFAVDMVALPKGFPLPITAMRPLIRQALEMVAPEFDGCAILCPACAPIRKINVQPSKN